MKWYILVIGEICLFLMMVATAIAIYRLRKSLREHSRKTKKMISSLVKSIRDPDDKIKQNNQSVKEESAAEDSIAASSKRII